MFDFGFYRYFGGIMGCAYMTERLVRFSKELERFSNEFERF